MDVSATPSEIAARLAHLCRLPATPGIVSVYLNTQWSDEHQRERTRVFLTRELRAAREAGVTAPDDLDWIERTARAVIAQAEVVDANGVALFANQTLGLREMVAVRVSFEERFVVDQHPDLAPLVELLDEHAAALVVFVDGESARLIPVYPNGVGEEVRLEAEIPSQHRRGGWAQLAQSRYARHIETHRDRHFEAVADAVTRVVDAQGLQRLLLAGHEDRLAAFREHLPERLQGLVIGHVHATRREPASAIASRAAERLDLQEHSDEASEVDAVLTEAAKGGRAIAGPATLEAARRGAIHRLYILAGWRRDGRECEQCRALQETGTTCRLCAGQTREVELGAALVDRVVRTGGSVETVVQHAGLADAAGVAARLRYTP